MKTPESVKLIKLTVIPCYAVYNKAGELLDEVTPRNGEQRAIDIYQASFSTFLDELKAQEEVILQALKQGKAQERRT